MIGTASAAINRELACLKTIFKRAEQEEKISTNPTKLVKLLDEDNVRDRVLTEAEFKALLLASPPHQRPALLMAWETGMRKGEILGLTWDRVNWKDGFIHLRGQDTKTITCVFLDIDPEREKGTNVTFEERRKAFDKSRQLLKFPCFSESALLCSGNGVHILTPVLVKENLQEFAQKNKDFVDRFRKQYFSPDEGLKLDSMHDLPRIAALAGTLKMKGPATEERPHHMVELIEFPKTENSTILVEAILSGISPNPEKEKSKEDSLSEMREKIREEVQKYKIKACPGIFALLREFPAIKDRSLVFQKIVNQLVAQQNDRNSIKSFLLELDSRISVKAGTRRKLVDQNPVRQDYGSPQLEQGKKRRKMVFKHVRSLRGDAGKIV